MPCLGNLCSPLDVGSDTLQRFLICEQDCRISVLSCFIFSEVHAEISGLCFRTSYLDEDKFLMTVPSGLKQYLIVLLDMFIKTGFLGTDISLHSIVYINGLHMFKSKVLPVQWTSGKIAETLWRQIIFFIFKENSNACNFTK